MKVSLRPGEAFNPFRMFTGLFIPEALARCPWISAGAKLVWGRLARYAGADGRCYPTVKTLGAEIGIGERQTQKYLTELEKSGLIRRRSCFAGRAQTSNTFEFLWHEIFEEGVNDRSGEGVNNSAPGGVNDNSPKESPLKESHTEESQPRRPRLSAHESQKRGSRSDSPRRRRRLAVSNIPECVRRSLTTCRRIPTMNGYIPTIGASSKSWMRHRELRSWK